jgi:DNA polymerase-4
MDYGKIKKLYGDELSFAYKLKDEIYNKLGFTVNIGIANNKLCAKMASDFSKPNKVHTLYKNEIEDKMWPLEVKELYGIGKKTNEKLSVLNINTIKDLALSSVEDLYKYFKNQSQYMIDIANGIDNSEVISEYADPKSMSNTTTLLYDYVDIEEINIELKKISDNLSIELRKQNKYAGVVAIIIKSNDFIVNTHQEKLKNSTNSSNDIYNVSKKLFKDSWNGSPVRLIGIRLDSLHSDNNYQMSLFENIDSKIKNEKLDQVVDKLRQKYGNKIINK